MPQMELTVILSAIGLVVGLLAQTVAIVWFFSRLSTRVDILEKNFEGLVNGRYEPRLTKIETIMEIVQVQQDEQIKRLDEIKTSLIQVQATQHRNQDNENSNSSRSRRNVG